MRVERDGYNFQQEYERGKPLYDLRQVGLSDQTGTTISFAPDPEVFEELVYSSEILSSRLRELAFLNKGISITLIDEREAGPWTKVFKYEGGVRDFVKISEQK